LFVCCLSDLYITVQLFNMFTFSSVGIDLKELGGQMSKCLKFCTGIEIYNQFCPKKISVCRRELGVEPPNPPAIPTLFFSPQCGVLIILVYYCTNRDAEC